RYWTPQLTYVEALYYMHIRYDSMAKARLTRIITGYAGTPMADKAKNTLRVLNDREKIEAYLTNLKVTRAKDDTLAMGKVEKPPVKLPPADSLAFKAVPKGKPDSAKMITAGKPDTLSAKKPVAFASAFVSAPEKPHAVVLIMNKVDPVYVTESRNAFDRYNRENYYAKHFDINIVTLSDSIRLVTINGFENADAALSYMSKAAAVSGREILPWLPANKYSFIIIDDQNLGILQSNKDISGYKQFLSFYFPGKFPPK
ncbi:MAG TPA: hypothetical protein VG890_01010, partial [Puia sp.]|nr:hypothetical protein [Puia sp.]